MNGLWRGMSVLAIVWVTNLYNFMDGTDGIAAGEGCFWGLSVVGLAWVTGNQQQVGIAACIAGVALGFLFFNRPPAKVFMGDVGSGSLGFLIAAFSLYLLSLDLSLGWPLLIVISVFAVDATATLLMRMWRGERWYNPHRDHAYQVLVRMGRSHGDVLSLFMSANVIWVLPMAFVAALAPSRVPITVAILSYLVLLGAWWQIQRRFSAHA